MKRTTFIISIIIVRATISPLSKNLISLGTTLLTLTILSTILISQLFNSWFAFILFLVFVTGLLVLFRYIVAIRPNSSFVQRKISTKVLLLLITTYSLINNSTLSRPIKREKRFEINLQQLFNLNNTPIYWRIGIILLIALLIAVIISYKSAKPLRSFL